MSHLARLVGTWFYLGYVPKAPGTAGSFGGLLVAILLHHHLSVPIWGIGIAGLILIAPAIWSANVIERQAGGKDPQIVVVDEVVGQLITISGAPHVNPTMWAVAFVLFRAFDILKPPPVRWFERLPGGTGIVLDDAIAGIYGALVLALAGWFNLY